MSPRRRLAAWLLTRFVSSFGAARATAKGQSYTPNALGPPPATCQWIDGLPGPDDACKCGRPVVPGRPWCTIHIAFVYEPPSPEHCVWQLAFGPHPGVCAAEGYPCACCPRQRRSLLARLIPWPRKFPVDPAAAIGKD